MHVYILGPDGSAFSGLDIGSALTLEKLIAALETAIATMNPTPGSALFPPRVRSIPPKSDDTSLVFHLVARGREGVSWRDFPAENWLVLSKDEWNQLLPDQPVALKSTWEVPPAVTQRFYEWFYPAAEDSSVLNRSKITESSMRMTVVALANGVARARIEGFVKLTHSFYPGRNTNEAVNATVLGFLDFVVANRQIQRMRVITDKAVYKDENFQIALRSVSRQTLDAFVE